MRRYGKTAAYIPCGNFRLKFSFAVNLKVSGHISRDERRALRPANNSKRRTLRSFRQG